MAKSGNYELKIINGKLGIQALVDPRGCNWYLEQHAATALQVDLEEIKATRTSNPGEFREGEDYNTVRWQRKRYVAYSQAGFFKLCAACKSERAYRLTVWMQQSFEAEQTDSGITVRSKTQPGDGGIYSLGGTMRPMHSGESAAPLLPAPVAADLLAQGETMLQGLQGVVDALKGHQMVLRGHSGDIGALRAGHANHGAALQEHDSRISVLEQSTELRPGEMHANELADQIGWYSAGRYPHGSAVIQAARNALFVEDGIMFQRQERVTGAGAVPTWVFSQRGVHVFMTDVDAQYLGDEFEVPAVTPGGAKTFTVYRRTRPAE